MSLTGDVFASGKRVPVTDHAEVRRVSSLCRGFAKECCGGDLGEVQECQTVGTCLSPAHQECESETRTQNALLTAVTPNDYSMRIMST